MEVILSKKGIDLIIASEVSSEAYYTKFLQKPTWPGGESGITCGIGDDFGQQSEEKIKEDWQNLLSVNELNILLKCVGIKGIHAKNLLETNKDIKSLVITYNKAYEVFLKSSIPKYLKETLKIYPKIEELKPDAISALLSMIYNRGASIEGSNRSEMAAIVPLIPMKNYSAIATLVEHSKRLWVGKPGMQGIINRRIAESKLILNADHDYTDDEIETITI